MRSRCRKAARRPSRSSSTTAPLNPTTVTVSRVSGDTNITVQSGGLLVFNASNWNTNQTVTLRRRKTRITKRLGDYPVQRAGLADQDVTVTEQDNDGINLALASRGSTITGSNGANWSNLIDGVTTGYTGNTGFGFTLWTNAANAPGSMTLDLKGLCTISSMRVLLWDLDSRYYRYKIEASSNNTTGRRSWTGRRRRTNAGVGRSSVSDRISGRGTCG